jgi:hypothetical protein
MEFTFKPKRDRPDSAPDAIRRIAPPTSVSGFSLFTSISQRAPQDQAQNRAVTLQAVVAIIVAARLRADTLHRGSTTFFRLRPIQARVRAADRLVLTESSDMETVCPRCKTANREVARFCARCGLSLDIGVDGSRRGGQVRHPRPTTVPRDYRPCDQAADLYYRTESSSGGQTLIATEGVNVLVFNSGYLLRQVVLEVRGEGDGGRELFSVERTVDELPQGKEVAVEIPSYELPAPLRTLAVRLVSAEFGWEG